MSTTRKKQIFKNVKIPVNQSVKNKRPNVEFFYEYIFFPV